MNTPNESRRRRRSTSSTQSRFDPPLDYGTAAGFYPDPPRYSLPKDPNIKELPHIGHHFQTPSTSLFKRLPSIFLAMLGGAGLGIVVGGIHNFVTQNPHHHPVECIFDYAGVFSLVAGLILLLQPRAHPPR